MMPITQIRPGVAPARARSTTSAFGNVYLFTGRRLDEKTGLYHYRRRQYDAPTGRFLNRDPLQYIDSMNAYAYVRNNPVNAVDPSGQAAVSTLILTFIAAAAAAGLIVALYKLYRAYKEAQAIERRLSELSKLKKGVCLTSESFLAISREEAALRRRLNALAGEAAAAVGKTGITTPGTQGLPGPSLGPKPVPRGR